MTVSLVKGGQVSLSKKSEILGINELSKLAVGIGWDVSDNGISMDADAWVLAFKSDVKELVYFANLSDKTGYIHHTGDNLTGAGDGDDETVDINLEKLYDKYDYILVGMSIYKASEKGQKLSDIKNVHIRVYDKNTEKDLCYFGSELKSNKLKNDKGIIFGVIYKENNEWQFMALEEGLDYDSISSVKRKTSLSDVIELINKYKSNGGNKDMAVNLSKGGKVSLAKVAADAGIAKLSKLVVGLGWDVNKYDGGAEFDLDASAFCCGENGKVTCDDDFVFYNNKVRPGVEHTGDNRTGEGDGDDETIKIDLDAIPANISEINFTVTINDFDKYNLNFGMVENSYIRVVDETTGQELIKYDLGEDFSSETALVVAKLYRHNGEWKFNAIGSGFAGGLYALCKNFGVNV